MAVAVLEGFLHLLQPGLVPVASFTSHDGRVDAPSEEEFLDAGPPLPLGPCARPDRPWRRARARSVAAISALVVPPPVLGARSSRSIDPPQVPPPSPRPSSRPWPSWPILGSSAVPPATLLPPTPAFQAKAIARTACHPAMNSGSHLYTTTLIASYTDHTHCKPHRPDTHTYT